MSWVRVRVKVRVCEGFGFGEGLGLEEGLLINFPILQVNDFEKNNGGWLLKSYGGSPQSVIESLSDSMPSPNAIFLRKKKPQNFWVLLPFLSLLRSFHLSYVSAWIDCIPFFLRIHKLIKGVLWKW